MFRIIKRVYKLYFTSVTRFLSRTSWHSLFSHSYQGSKTIFSSKLKHTLFSAYANTGIGPPLIKWYRKYSNCFDRIPFLLHFECLTQGTFDQQVLSHITRISIFVARRLLSGSSCPEHCFYFENCIKFTVHLSQTATIQKS